jgi:hypothetical protein
MYDLALISEPDRSSLMVYHVYPVSQYDSSIRSRNVTKMHSLASPQINIAEFFFLALSLQWKFYNTPRMMLAGLFAIWGTSPARYLILQYRSIMTSLLDRYHTAS